MSTTKNSVLADILHAIPASLHPDTAALVERRPRLASLALKAARVSVQGATFAERYRGQDKALGAMQDIIAEDLGCDRWTYEEHSRRLQSAGRRVMQWETPSNG